jgi:hypothetical protein
VVGGSAGTKRRAAEALSDFGFKSKPGAPSPSGRSSSACSHPSWGVVERKAKRLGWESGKRQRNEDNRNDRNSKRSVVIRVCKAGEGSGSDFGAGGSGNGASGGEMVYDGRVAGIGASAGKEGDMGRIGQIGDGGKRGVLM